MMTSISKCRVCGSSQLDNVMSLGEQALTGVFPKSRSEQLTSGPVDLVRCAAPDGCGLVQLEQSYSLSEMYGMNYGYRSGLNASMVRHLHDKVSAVLALNVLKEGDIVIDIGSNDGTTLCAYPQGKYELIGVDPTGVKFQPYYPPQIKLLPDFFSAALVEKALKGRKAKIITSFSMFYDLEDPIAFAREIAGSLAPDGVWMMEQSYLVAMLQTNSFDTICHEHLEFYVLKQIMWIAEHSGLKVLDAELNGTNGGSMSVTLAKASSAHEPNHAHIQKILDDEASIGLDDSSAFVGFKERVAQEQAKLMAFLHQAKADGQRVCGLGASTKGNVLLQYYGIDDSLIESIGEVNEDKFGAFTPATHIPLVSEDVLLKSNPDYLVILPWHFRDFFLRQEKFKGRKLVFPLPSFEIVQL